MGDLVGIYQLLYDVYGPQGWWEADSKFEIVVGAILTQSTSWSNVERAISRLRDESMLSVRAIREVNENALAEIIRPCGYGSVKARRLKAFVAHLCERHSGDLDRMLSQELIPLRSELLGIYGIGPETADSILLYAGGHLTFVVDSYTRRLFYRLGKIDDPRIGYEEMRKWFMDRLPADVQLYNEFHALIVRHCKDRCGKRDPRCAGCALRDRCNHITLQKGRGRGMEIWAGSETRPDCSKTT